MTALLQQARTLPKVELTFEQILELMETILVVDFYKSINVSLNPFIEKSQIEIVI